MFKMPPFRSRPLNTPKLSPRAFNFKVEREENNFQVRNRAGVRQYGTGYPEIALQEGLDSLGDSRIRKEEQGKVLAKKEFNSVGDTLIIDSFTDFEFQKMTLANAVNKPILKNADQTDGNVMMSVHGGYIDGNSANQTSENPETCALLDFRKCAYDLDTQESETWRYSLKLEGMNIYRARGHAVFISQCNLIEMDLVRIRAAWEDTVLATADALHLYVVADSSFSRLGLEAKQYGLWTSYCNTNIMKSSYVGGSKTGWMNDGGSSQWEVNNFRVDNCDEEGIVFTGWDGIQGMILNNIHVTYFRGDTTNTKDALLIRDDGGAQAQNNQINMFFAGNRGSAKAWRYGINEIDGDYNTFGMINGRECGTAALRKLGANSKHVADLIQGSVVTS